MSDLSILFSEHTAKTFSIDEMMIFSEQARSDYSLLSQNEICTLIGAVIDDLSEICSLLAKGDINENACGRYEDRIRKLRLLLTDLKHSCREISTEPMTAVGTVVVSPERPDILCTLIIACILCLKSGAPAVFYCTPDTSETAYRTLTAIHDSAVRHGAPEHFIQWTDPEASVTMKQLISHRKCAVWITGSSPHSFFNRKLLRIIPVNIPCIIHSSAHIETAARHILSARCFDYGGNYACFQSIFVDNPVYDAFKRLLPEQNIYLVSDDEAKRLIPVLIQLAENIPAPEIYGQPSHIIAKMADIDIPKNTQAICMEKPAIPAAFPAPILTLTRISGISDAVMQLRQSEMSGTPCMLYADSRIAASQLSQGLPGSAVTVNPSLPFLTPVQLFQSSYGDFLTPRQLFSSLKLPKKIVIPASRAEHFIFPKQIISHANIFQSKYIFEQLCPDASSIMLLTAASAELPPLSKLHRDAHIIHHVFVPDEPITDEIYQTVFREFVYHKPDLLAVFGSTNIINAARLLPRSQDCLFICITDSAGAVCGGYTFSKIFKPRQQKLIYSRSKSCMPDILIHQLSPLTADSTEKLILSGVQALSDAYEACLSVEANDYTDAMASCSIKLIHSHLLNIADYTEKNENDSIYPQDDHITHAMTMSSIALGNTGPGLFHAAADAVYCYFPISYALICSVLLPLLIGLNMWADCKILKDLPDSHEINHLLRTLNLPVNFHSCHIREKDYMNKITDMAESIYSNPILTDYISLPDISALEDLFRQAF